MAELSYRWSEKRFLESNDSSTLVIAAVWLIFYLTLFTLDLIMPGLPSTTDITAALSR